MGNDPAPSSQSLEYDVQYRVGNMAYTDWLTDVGYSEASFRGTPGYTYTFQVRIRDGVGNQSGWVQSSVVAVSKVTKYYTFGASRVAMRQGDQVYYLHGDHLGSTSLTTDQNGALVSQARYLPFGQERWTDGASPTDFTFTAQRSDSFGLMDYNARYYSAYLNRFISPDTLIPNPANLQSFNRYSYVANNPLRYIDPTGHLGEDEIEKYFGYKEREEMEEALGEAVTNQIWGTEDFTWGDVLEYDGGNAILALFETGEGTGVYQGGFYGVSGDDLYQKVSLSALKDSERAGKNVKLTEDYKKSGWSNLPKIWMNDLNSYNANPTTYVDLGVTSEALFYGGTATTVGQLVVDVGKWVPNPWVRGGLTAFSVGSMVLGAADKFSGGAVIGGAYKDYPVIGPPRPYRYSPTTYHPVAPTGKY